MKTLRLLMAVCVFAGTGLAQATKPAQPLTASGAGLEKLKSLAGEWQGTMQEGGKDLAATSSFRVVSDGSAVMNVLGAGTPYEMVTMFHQDNLDLLATHYCGAHNQPRFRMVPSAEANVLNFEFKDATNLSSPDAPHMVGLKITFLNANHHYEDWTFFQKGQKSTSRFDLHRKS